MNEPFSKPDVSRASTVAVASGTSWVSVADLQAGQVPVQWSEAVAVLAELCAVLLGRGDDVIPHPADVLVNGEGELLIRAQDRGEADPAALGRMLHGLFATGPTPASLRLFVSHAISSERHHSVSAFAEALASYEVPGRNKLIQAAHHRWVATRTAAASSVPEPALPQPEQEKKPAKPNAGASRIPRWAIATAGVAVVMGGATGAWFAAGAKPISISIPSVSLSVPATIQQAWARLSATTPSDTTAAEPEAKDTKRARAAKPRTATGGARPSNPVLDPATVTVVTETTPATESGAPPVETVVPGGVTATTRIGSDTPAPAAGGASPAPAATGETPGTLDDVARVVDARVYSNAFPEVKPPVMMPRQMAPPEAQTPGVEATSTIELLVDESGGVERVRLLSRPSPILATMLLSAAKTWKFRPALNDGRPVKYRLLLDVTTTRP